MQHIGCPHKENHASNSPTEKGTKDESDARICNVALVMVAREDSKVLETSSSLMEEHHSSHKCDISDASN